MAFQSTNIEYQIVTDSEVASVISHFSEDMIYDILLNNLQNKFRPYAPSLPNLVLSYENNFKQFMQQYPNYQEDFSKKREEVYLNIIQELCKFHNLEYIGNNEFIDVYSSAYLLYDFFISNFTKNIITFFVNYINREKNSLYEILNLAEMKKNKDSATLYSKKLYKNCNGKIAMIHANIELVVNQICFCDIDLNTLLDIVYMDRKNVAKTIGSMIGDKGSFFNQFYVPFVQAPEFKYIILSEISLQLLQLPMLSNDIDIVGGKE